MGRTSDGPLTGLTTRERIEVRRSLIKAGFTRIAFTDDEGDGAYSETYAGPGNTSIVLTWAPKKEGDRDDS